MDAVLRAAAIYCFLMVLFRLSGRRTLAELTMFDFVLLLIIAEATQQALLGDDFSVINAFLVIGALIGMDILFGQIRARWPRFERWSEGVPMILLENGRPLRRRMQKTGIDLDDILRAARENEGLERVEDIRYAILEVNGRISVIPER